MLREVFNSCVKGHQSCQMPSFLLRNGLEYPEEGYLANDITLLMHRA